jgi:hypothetical protein
VNKKKKIPIWIDVNQKLPPTGSVVLCKITYFKGNKTQEQTMIKVDEDDCDWRTADDHSELNFDWTVSYWAKNSFK